MTDEEREELLVNLKRTGGTAMSNQSFLLGLFKLADGDPELQREILACADIISEPVEGTEHEPPQNGLRL